MIQKNWQDLIKPQRLDVQPGRRPDREATIVVEPLERGFGITLGNALRRVLLSSLQGAAITQVQIDGVLHEFSSIAGVREDVTDIVLNLKALGLRMHSDSPKRMHLKVEGPAIVTAGMIEVGHDIEIMDPDHVICHVDKGGKLSIEMTVQPGKGYVPASLNKNEDAPIGLIAIDAIYSPVRKVAYKVDNARVGQQTDYDRLTLQVETDGSVTPDDAVGLAARILSRQGYRVLTAANLAEALRQMDASTVDLLLSDVVMPDANGHSLVDRLRARQPGLKHLFMTGYPAEVIAQRCGVVDDSHVVQKPFDRASLSRAVRTVLDER